MCGMRHNRAMTSSRDRVSDRHYGRFSVRPEERTIPHPGPPARSHLERLWFERERDDGSRPSGLAVEAFAAALGALVWAGVEVAIGGLLGLVLGAATGAVAQRVVKILVDRVVQNPYHPLHAILYRLLARLTLIADRAAFDLLGVTVAVIATALMLVVLLSPIVLLVILIEVTS
jgi:hypothetical protein